MALFRSTFMFDTLAASYGGRWLYIGVSLFSEARRGFKVASNGQNIDAEQGLSVRAQIN